MRISSKQKDRTVSILIPVYNEENTIDILIQKVLHEDIINWKKQIIVINDGSTDQTADILEKYKNDIIIMTHLKNYGMGKALQSGFTKATGDIILFQDADLEYNPHDIPKILSMYDKQNVQAVYGSRYMYGAKRGYLSYYLGAKFLTWLVNALYNTNGTDIFTGYKSFRTSLLPSLIYHSFGFEFNMEITLSLLKKHIIIFEVPISYTPRSFSEGKKISLWVGIRNIGIIFIRRFR
jgi:dolichol-phosphate mannosyltransferase